MKEPLLYKIIRPIISISFKMFFCPKIVGQENLKIESPFVLAGNHTSYLDPILLLTTEKRVIHFLAKDSLNKGIKKIIFKNMGIIPVNRKIKDKSVLINAYNCLTNGMIVGVFPEGTINRTKDTIIPFKIGAVKMAHDAQVPLVPFIITGKYKLFGGSKIKFLPALHIEDNLTRENEKIMQMIKDNIERNK